MSKNDFLRRAIDLFREGYDLMNVINILRVQHGASRSEARNAAEQAAADCGR